MKPKLIVTDLDGTALRNDKTLSEEERASLRSMLLRLIETLEREVAK